LRAARVRPRLWIILAILAAIAIVLAIEGGTIADIERTDLAWIVAQFVLLVVVGGFALTLFRGRLTQALEAALIWVAIAVLLAVGYTYRFELRQVADRVLAELVPGHAASRGRVVEIARGGGGNFAVVTHVNGARIAMVLDTGASSVVLTQEAAKAAGLPLEVLSYSVVVDTANGRTRAAPVTLDRLAVGGIIERAVPALIAQPGQLRTNLLGLSFLSRLESYEVRGDKLVLRGYP
jgi:aspartyl protease family protein